MKWISNNSKFLLRALLILLCLLILITLGEITLPLITGKNMKSYSFGENLPITNPDNFTLAVRVDDSGNGVFKIKLDTIIVPSSINNKVICIHELYALDQNEYNEYWRLAFMDMVPLGHIAGFPTGYFPSFDGVELWKIKEVSYENNPYIHILSPTIGLEFKNLCTENDAQVLSDSILEYKVKFSQRDSQIPDIIPKPNSVSAFFYPFDHQHISIMFWLQTTEAEIIAPNIIGVITPSGWSTEVNTNYSDLNVSHLNGRQETKQIKTLSIEFKRPLAYRILNILLLIVLVTFIVALIYIKETSNFLALALGILFGFGGLEGILQLPNQKEFSLISATFLTLYFLFTIAIFIRIAIKPLWNLSGKEPKINPKKSSRSKSASKS